MLYSSKDSNMHAEYITVFILYVGLGLLYRLIQLDHI